MKKKITPYEGVIADAWVKTYEEDMAKLKTACENKYGLKPVPGKNVPFFTPKQFAEYLRKTTKTLERWRKTGKGPAFKKLINRRIRYYIKDVEAWLDQQNGISAGG